MTATVTQESCPESGASWSDSFVASAQGYGPCRWAVCGSVVLVRFCEGSVDFRVRGLYSLMYLGAVSHRSRSGDAMSTHSRSTLSSYPPPMYSLFHRCSV